MRAEPEVFGRARVAAANEALPELLRQRVALPSNPAPPAAEMKNEKEEEVKEDTAEEDSTPAGHVEEVDWDTPQDGTEYDS